MTTPILPIDQWQRAAAEAPEGPVMILGGPGSGTSYTLTARVAALLKHGTPPHHITCVAISHRGAWDLRRRMREFPEGLAADALNIYIGTPNQFAIEILRSGGVEVLGLSPHFSIWDHRQAVDTIIELAKIVPGDPDVSPRQTGEEIYRRYSLNQAMRPENALPARDSSHRRVMAHYRDEKCLQHALDPGRPDSHGHQGHEAGPGTEGNVGWALPAPDNRRFSGHHPCRGTICCY